MNTADLIEAIDDLADNLHDYTEAYTNGNRPTIDPHGLAEALCFLHVEVEEAMRQLESILTEEHE